MATTRQQRLIACQPEVAWEVVNQAHAHRWNGLPAMLRLMRRWPAGQKRPQQWGYGWIRQIMAPLGLEDLFALRVRRNPAFADGAAYQRRLSTKNWLRRWPHLTQVD